MSEQENHSPLMLESGTFFTRLTRKFNLRKPYEKDDPRVIKAVIPGVIAEIDTAVGRRVKRGERLMILEAMKMHNRIMAPHDGRIKTVLVSAGEKVVKGQVLAEME